MTSFIERRKTEKPNPFQWDEEKIIEALDQVYFLFNQAAKMEEAHKLKKPVNFDDGTKSSYKELADNIDEMMSILSFHRYDSKLFMTTVLNPGLNFLGMKAPSCHNRFSKEELAAVGTRPKKWEKVRDEALKEAMYKFEKNGSRRRSSLDVPLPDQPKLL